jgi:hypothetical protein
MSKPLLLRRDTVLTHNSDNLINSGDIYNTTSALSTSLTTAEGKLKNAILIFNNKTIATSAWTADTTYEDFPYVTAISCANVTANHFPEVVFSVADASSGMFSPVCESIAGGVKVWATEVPKATITIPSIKCSKEVK